MKHGRFMTQHMYIAAVGLNYRTPPPSHGLHCCSLPLRCCRPATIKPPLLPPNHCCRRSLLKPSPSSPPVPDFSHGDDASSGVPPKLATVITQDGGLHLPKATGAVHERENPKQPFHGSGSVNGPTNTTCNEEVEDEDGSTRGSSPVVLSPVIASDLCRRLLRWCPRRLLKRQV